MRLGIRYISLITHLVGFSTKPFIDLLYQAVHEWYKNCVTIILFRCFYSINNTQYKQKETITLVFYFSFFHSFVSSYCEKENWNLRDCSRIRLWLTWNFSEIDLLPEFTWDQKIEKNIWTLHSTLFYQSKIAFVQGMMLQKNIYPHLEWK